MTKRFFSFSSSPSTDHASWLLLAQATRSTSSRLRVPRRKVTVEKTLLASLPPPSRLGLLFERVGEDEREQAVPEHDAAQAEALVGHEAITSVAVVLARGAVHAVVKARTAVMGDQVCHQGVMGRLAVDFHALDEQR